MKPHFYNFFKVFQKKPNSFSKVLGFALFVAIFGQLPNAHAQSRLAFMHGADDNSGTGSGVSIWVSNGNGTFKQCKISDTGFDRDNLQSEVFGDDGSSTTFYADVTGDGVVDIVHASEYGGTNAIHVYRGNGRGGFSKTAITTSGMQSGSDGYVFTGNSGGESSFLADVNGDGNLDYVTSGNDRNIHTYLGNGNGTFATSRVSTTLTGANGYQTSGISTAEVAFLTDVNGDGKADLVATNEGDGRSIRVWLATTLGNFNATPVTTTGFQQTGSSIFTGIGGNETSAMIDVNGDGKMDFVHTNEFDANNDIFTFLGNGDGSFATTYVRSVVTNPAGTYYQAIGDWAGDYAQWIDVTGDNKVDFVTSADYLGVNSGIYVYTGNGDGTFNAAPIVTLGCGGFQTGSDFTETTRIVQVFSTGTTFANNCRVNPTGTTTAPGGVNDLLLWLKADDLTANAEGTSLATWSDSLSWGSVGQYYPTYRPTFNKTTASKLVNFNPSVSFNGGQELKTDHRLYCNNSQFQLVSVALDERNNPVELRAPFGIGGDGNYPAMDMQTDGISPNGFNPWMSYSSPAEWGAGTGVLYNGNTGGTNRQPQIFSLGSTNASTSAVDNIVSWVDGKKDATTLDAKQQTEIGNGMFLGSSGDAQWLGRIPETLIFTRQLNDGEMQKVNSYLAIKYGITLSQTMAQNYLASDSSVLWNATTNAAYKSDIVVIGRDDASGLNQKQSKSVNTGIQPIISLGAIAATNQANTGSFLTNKNFEAIGHNDLAANYATAYAPSSFTPVAPFYRMNRIWKVQETGTIGTVTIGIPLSNGAERLLVSTDASFAPASTQEILLTNDGNDNLKATVDLADGQFFTFGRIAVAPGCVVSGLQMWLKADAGVTGSTAVTKWDDQSVNGRALVQNTTGNAPAANATINFNPAFTFDGVNDRLEYKGTRFMSTTSSGTMYGAATNKYDGGYENLGVLGIDNPHMGTLANQQIMWMNSSAPVRIDQPGTLTPDQLYTWGYFWNGGTPDVGSGLRLDGKEFYDATTEATAVGSSGVSDGMFTVGSYEGLENWNGKIAEVILYDRNLTNVEKDKIETYLAIRYGNSLKHNYLSGAGVTIYDTTGYVNNIAGIGKEVCQGLNQKQSKSVNSGVQPIIGLARIDSTNAANTTEFAANNSFMVWGSNTGATNFGTAITPPAGISLNNRYGRIWKIQETGTVGIVKVAFPIRSGNGATVYLVRSTDATFDATDEFTPLSNLTVSGKEYLAANINFNNGDYFTVATFLTAPGCVASNLGLWLKADFSGTSTGENAEDWQDHSTNVNDVEVNGTMILQKGDANHNFQPYFGNFSATNFFKDMNSSLAPQGAFLASEVTMIAAVRPNTSTGTGRIMGIDNDDNFSGEPALSLSAGNPNYYRYWNTTKDFVTTTIPTTANQSTVISARTNGTEIKLGNNGAFESSTVVAGSGMWGDIMTVGYGSWSAAGAFPGEIQEVIWYKSALSNTEVQKINSYLGIKYGTSLNHPYLSGAGTTIYDTTGYAYNIAGIGRELCQGLNQKQSRSQNVGVQPIIALTALAETNFDNSATLEEGAYMIWGSTSGTGTFSNTINVPASVTANNRFSRIWKVQETGTVGTVQVALPSTLGNGATVYLVRSTDATFDASDEYLPLSIGVPSDSILTVGGSDYLATTINFNNGDYFTIATYLTAPGCVAANLNLWLKADKGLSSTTDGTTLNYWANQSINGIDSVYQATATARPTVFNTTKGNLVNFNPSLSFDGGDELISSNRLFSNTAPFTTIAMAIDRRTNTAELRAPMGMGYGNGNFLGLDFQTDGVSPYGFNPYSGVDAEWGNTTPNYRLNGLGHGSTNQNGNIVGLTTNNVAAGSDNVIAYVNGSKDNTTISANQNALFGNGIYVGSSGDAQWLGLVPEVIVYDRQLTDAEMQRVYSYLAIKYGTTLKQPYLNGAGNVVYDTTGYSKDIAGIAYEKCQGLNQKQSQSGNQGVRPTMSLGSIAATNEANANTFAADNSFEIWGSNGLAAGYNVTYTPSSYTPIFPFKYMNRQWKVQETGTVGPVTVKINSNADYLLVDTDGDGNFATGTIDEIALTNKQATYNFKNGDVFTFGREVVVQTCNNGLAFVHGDDATYAASGGGAVTEGLSAWRSNGDGTFSNTRITQTGFNRNNTGTEVFGNDVFASTYTSDVDNDGDVDMIHVTEDNANSIYVYLNNGNSTFQTTPIVTTGMQMGTNNGFAGQSAGEQGWIGDANGDGNVDYIFSGNDAQVHVYLGSGDGKFALTRISSTLIATGYLTSGISGAELFLVADVNNDGSIDLVGTYDPGHMRVWLGNGDGSFQAYPYFDADIQDSGTSNSSGSADDEYSQFADVDADGDLDYVHAEGMDGTPQIWAFLNNGDGTFATNAVLTQASTNPGVGLTDFANYNVGTQSFFADVNSDGKADYISTIDNNGVGSQNGIYVYLATSNGSFAVTPIATPITTGFATGSNNATETSFIACGIVVCNAGNNAPSVSATKTNICPATMANLSTIVPDNSPSGVVTTWHTATPATLSNRVADSTAVGAGVYYAAFLDKINGCISPTSTAVTVTINACTAPDLKTTIYQPNPSLVANTASNLPVSVKNVGGASASGVITTIVTLPTGVSTPTNFTTNGSTCNRSGQTVTCTNAGPIAVNDSILLNVPITPSVLLVGSTPTFNATTNPVSGETNTSNNAATPTTASTAVVVLTAPDLTTTIGQPNPALVVGQASNLPITLNNVGTGSAPGVITTTITLPTGVTAPATFINNGWTCLTSAPTVTCTNLGPIAAGGSSTFNVPVTPNASVVGTNPVFNANTFPVIGETNTSNNIGTPTPTAAAVQAASCNWTPGGIGK